MDQQELRLEIVKASLMGGMVLNDGELNRMYKWVDESDQPSSASEEKDLAKNLTGHSADDIPVTKGEFIVRMSSEYSPRIVTKCQILFKRMGIKTIKDIRKTSRTQIMSERNTGKTTVNAISGTMKMYGIPW